MAELRTPDALSTQAENELICERLLKWKPARISGLGVHMWHAKPYADDGDQWVGTPTPSFTTWADAGLILDALFEKHHEQIEELKLEIDDDLDWKFVLCWDRYEKMVVRYSQHCGPVAIRAAALEFIRSLP